MNKFLWAEASLYEKAARFKQANMKHKAETRGKTCNLCLKPVFIGEFAYQSSSSSAPGGRYYAHEDCVSDTLSDKADYANRAATHHEGTNCVVQMASCGSDMDRRFTKEALQDLARLSVGVPVTKEVGGPVIGQIYDAEVKDECLYAKVNLKGETGNYITEVIGQSGKKLELKADPDSFRGEQEDWSTPQVFTEFKSYSKIMEEAQAEDRLRRGHPDAEAKIGEPSKDRIWFKIEPYLLNFFRSHPKDSSFTIAVKDGTVVAMSSGLNNMQREGTKLSKELIDEPKKPGFWQWLFGG